MRLGESERAVFWSFSFVSAQLQGFANLRLRQRPMIGTTRQNSKILTPHGYSFSSNALTRKSGRRTSRRNDFSHKMIFLRVTPKGRHSLECFRRNHLLPSGVTQKPTTLQPCASGVLRISSLVLETVLYSHFTAWLAVLARFKRNHLLPSGVTLMPTGFQPRATGVLRTSSLVLATVSYSHFEALRLVEQPARTKALVASIRTIIFSMVYFSRVGVRLRFARCGRLRFCRPPRVSSIRLRRQQRLVEQFLTGKPNFSAKSQDCQ
jgi:hypothetical protein